MKSESWLVVIGSAPKEPDSREMLELVLAGASLGASLDVVFVGAGAGHARDQAAVPWRQLTEFDLATLWCVESGDQADGLAPDVRVLDQRGLERFAARARGVLEL